jgi:hypothetical protein
MCNFSLNLRVKQFILFTKYHYGDQMKDNEKHMQAGHIR